MKVTIINGSPKGDNSLTLQYLLYIQKHFPQYEYETFNIGKKIKSIEKNEDQFNEIIDSVKASEAVFWVTPIFYFLIPAQLKRFIELIHERKAAKAFEGKYTSAVSTSIRFFDTTAHHYLHAVCDDLNMKYVSFHSLDMWDMFESSARKQLYNFAANFFAAVENKEPVSLQYPPLPKKKMKAYTPGKSSGKIDSKGKKILVVSDGIDAKTNLGKMINKFAGSIDGEVNIVDINELGIKGGCTSCVQCGYENICIYKDGFTDFWKNTMGAADIIIFAGEIRDRYLSAQWKMVFDRSFFMNHTPSIIGKQLGFLISGPLNQVANLKLLLQGYVEGQMCNFLDFVTDEYEDSKKIDSLITAMADRAIRFHDQGYIRTHTFLKEGGMKIFRDDVYGRLRFVCQADHRWYRDNGIYDTFPQRNKYTKKLNRRFMFLTRFKKFRVMFYKKVNKEMLRPIHNIAVHPDK
ncbi:MAG: hypothetical protein GY754_26215 [bacterium]|nr:hypothetical protein [bacterium]